jgi:glutaminyl-peptide cyclotransferase
MPIQAERPFSYLEQICRLGPRITGSPGMVAQQKLLEDLFRSQGGVVEWQRFDHRHPLTGEAVQISNLIVRWHPEKRRRVLLCAHYDTRPYADQDPDPAKRKEPLLGANDGASGVAVLAELGHWIPGLKPHLGIDFVLFDAEEFIFEENRDPYFLGSEYFARDYKANPPRFSYKYAVLLDLVGDKDLRILKEGYSVSWRDSKPLVDDIWKTAKRLGVREFAAATQQGIRDDHLALHNIAGIPSCDIIDFDYGPPNSTRSYWHTTQDTPDKCSGESLAKVAWVLLEWLKQAK